ncbi:MAG: cytochrome C oxidase Cbb3, partial [Bacteroidetes bacterium]
ETERYGQFSKSGEFVYDHPFLWGSKRTGPDLMREGTLKLKRGNNWHYSHMLNTQSTSAGSIMPNYPWLFENQVDFEGTKAKLQAMRTLGVPYTLQDIENSASNMKAQADKIVEDLKKEGLEAKSDQEIIALIAYLQRLGTDIEK